jgi:molecular chaperone GrpE
MANQFARHEPDNVATAGDDAPPSPANADADADEATEPDPRLLRAIADVENLRKRFQREVMREREAERARAVGEWLPVIDDLDRALEHVPDDEKDGLANGVRAVRDHALDVVARLGFPRFEDVGERFDPARHEAVSAIEAVAPPGTVVAVVRPGYGTPEVTLRPAAVVVARA